MLKGKTAVVTGAAKGIGKAIAVRFAQEGCNIVLNYRSSVVEEVIKEIESCGGECFPVKGDVSKFEDAEAVLPLQKEILCIYLFPVKLCL